MDSDEIVVMNDGIIAEYGMPAAILTKQNELFVDMNNDNELSSVSK
jgi:ABC-type multidrug transport system fused ATPase/permease subunit